MKTAFVLYPDMTALDLVGPYEIISRWPDAEVHFLARSLEPVRCDEGLTLIPTDTPATLPEAELIVVPGSGKPVQVLSDQVLIDWLRAAAPTAHRRYFTQVSGQAVAARLARGVARWRTGLTEGNHRRAHPACEPAAPSCPISAPPMIKVAA